MTESVFSALVQQELSTVPERIKSKLTNVAFLVEADPSLEVRLSEALAADETLLGLYQGIPLTERGDVYGVGVTLPDTITLYMNPILAEAGHDESAVRTVIRETLWHEIGHYFGLDEVAVGQREQQGTNTY
jgi:predicted Zn-dependent protease with MMP-like domain